MVKRNMKYVVLLCTCLLCTYLSAQAPMQNGCVKTRGRMVNGKHVPGLGLSGTVVSVKDRNDIAVKSKDGYFSFPIKGAQYVVQSVTKKDYALVDADAAPKTYQHTADTVYFLMETPDRITQDKLESERRIRRTLLRQLQEREDEIEALKTENKISQQEYQKALQKLYADQENNEKLISEMVERYSKLDYDQMNNFYRQVNNYIENGELTRADSLLKTRGDVQSQVEAELKKGETIAQKEKELQQAKAVHKHDIEELAQRCYSYFESFMMQHMNDSAAKYIELRARLDTTNVEWMNDAGGFITNFQAKYDRALRYYEAGLRQSIKQYGETSEWVAAFFNNIGAIYNSQGEYPKALEYYNKALEIRVRVFGTGHPDVATSYNNIGLVYDKQGEYPKALEYHNKALEISIKVLGTEHPHIATLYNNIGAIYNSQGEYPKSLEYYNKALEIFIKFFGTEHPHIATLYNNIGFVYDSQGEYAKALEYYNKALEIYIKIFGTEHPYTKSTQEIINAANISIITAG